jgi:hypothetical protein
MIAVPECVCYMSTGDWHDKAEYSRNTQIVHSYVTYAYNPARLLILKNLTPKIKLVSKRR